jgi:asparagine synthase (glutamine-hydrolysing)
MTMAASLEARIPFLDYRLIEFASSIPSNTKVKPFQAKYLLKRAYADFLPEPILTRKKMGFNVPISIWFRGEQRNLITNLLLSERARGRGFLNNEFVASMLRDHLEGRTQYGNQLFILASLELWFRVFIDNNRLEYPQMSVEQLLEEDASMVPSL